MKNRPGALAVEHIEYLHVASTDGKSSDRSKSSYPEANEEGHLPHKQ